MKELNPALLARACSKCGKCRTVCATYREEKTETLLARGRIHLAGRQAEGKHGHGPGLKKALTTCLLCLRCTEACPNHVDIEKIIIPGRAQLFAGNRRGFIESFIYKYFVSRRRPLALAAKMMGLSDSAIRMARITKVYRQALQAAGVDKKRRLPSFEFKNLYDLYPAAVTAPGNTRKAVYFPGCSTTLSLTRVGRAVIDLLVRSNTDVILPRFGCCGMPLFSGGEFGLSEKLAIENSRLLRESGADTVIVNCGSCGLMLKNFYPDLLGTASHGLKVMDITEYLADQGFKMGPVPIDRKVTWHDPCHLRRGLKVYEQPRALLKAIPGVEFVEMPEADTCCGCGGSLSLKYYGLSKKIRHHKMNMYQRTHAPILSTGCPACIFHLEDGMAELGLSGKLMHPAELISLTYNT